MIRIDVNIDTAQVRRLQAELADVRNGVPRAMSAAIRRTTDQARTRLIRGITTHVNVPARKIYTRGQSRGRPMRQRFSPPTGLVESSHIEILGETDAPATRSTKSQIGRIPITPERFGARAVRKGLTWKVRKKGARTKLEGAFLARFNSGFTGAFKRTGRGRSAITQLYGPSIPHVAEESPEVALVLNVDATGIFETNLASQVDRLLQRSRT